MIITVAATSMITVTEGQSSSVIRPQDITTHVKVLASDSFQGRRPFTKGELRTVDYIEETFRLLKLQAGNGKSYVQKVPLVEITPIADPYISVTSGNQSLKLKNREDYVLTTERTDSIISLDNDDVVFAGYGIVAPEYNWNDYAGINVRGKIVLVMVNDPGFKSGDPSFFKGDTMTYYGRWTYKYEEGARQGAKAVFIIHNTSAASYPFSVVQSSWGASNLVLDENDKRNKLPLRGWITDEAANRLLAFAGKDSMVKSIAGKRGFTSFSLGLKFSTQVHVKATHNTSQNVIAKIRGSKYPNEYIIYTAHWDHFGIGKPDTKGDSIYNGAYDNASGTAALLVIAKAFANDAKLPERSVLFLAVTGEEQGLLGSDYYAKHSIYPLKNTVADLNMDGMNPYGKTRDLVITGQGQSDLEDLVIKEAQKQGRYVTPDPDPQGGHYFRSDHFSFAKKGVPAIDLSWGEDFRDEATGYGKKLKADYRAQHYHQPSDEYDPKWTFQGGAEDATLLFNIGKFLADSHIWPQWKQGSEFRGIRR